MYRKIFCKDRLPGDDKDKKYIMTEMGFMFFHAGTETEEWRFTKTLDDLEDWEFPTYWFEEAKEPTDEEINKMAHENIPSPEFGFADKLFWCDGFRKALEILKGK